MRITDVAERSYGHAHFRERAEASLSRAQLLRRGAAVAGGVAGLNLLRATPAFAASSDPNPIAPNPGVPPPIAGLRLWLPGRGTEPSTITDFNGFVGLTEIAGTGTGGGQAWNFDVDMRFMKGVYRGMDGKIHQGAFAFV
jgi:hypothetical protein